MKLMKMKDSLLKQVDDLVEEMSKIELKIESINDQVLARKSIKNSRDAAKGNVNTSHASKKMKTIMVRRQLVDTARAQAEEIDYLRAELDKLRQKTFPSFVRAAKKRASGVH